MNATARIRIEVVGDFVGKKKAVLQHDGYERVLLISPAMKRLLDDPETEEATLRSLRVVTERGDVPASELLR